MKKIIVTVKDSKSSFNYDVELPTKLTVDKLTDDLMETLNGYNPGLSFRAETTVLDCVRLGRTLERGATLEQAGVWNGDVIVLTDSGLGRDRR